MVLYAESSGVLAWLLNERAGEGIRQLLASASHIVTSDLTLLEVGRALLRQRMASGIDAATHRVLKGLLDRAAARWTRLAIDDALLARAGQHFPKEPVRSLDAIHLASIVLAQAGLGGIVVLSLDERVRENADALGLAIAPH